MENSKIPEPIDKKFGVGGYVGDDFQHAKTQNDCPIRGVSVYAWNITLAWFIVSLFVPFLSSDLKFCFVSCQFRVIALLYKYESAENLRFSIFLL